MGSWVRHETYEEGRRTYPPKCYEYNNEGEESPNIVSDKKYGGWPTVFEDDPKAPFSIALTPRCKGECSSFPWIVSFTLDAYLIMMNDQQGGIKYHSLSLWYESTWEWTPVSWTIDEYSMNARGVVVIVIGTEHSDSSSNPRRDWLHFT